MVRLRGRAAAGFAFAEAARGREREWNAHGRERARGSGRGGRARGGFGGDAGRSSPRTVLRPRGLRAFKGASVKAHRAAVANLREVRAVVAAAAGGDFVGLDRAAAAAETLPLCASSQAPARRAPSASRTRPRDGCARARPARARRGLPGDAVRSRPGERDAAARAGLGADRARRGRDEEEQEDIEDADDF